MVVRGLRAGAVDECDLQIATTELFEVTLLIVCALWLRNLF
jgi:hypothetical protein